MRTSISNRKILALFEVYIRIHTIYFLFKIIEALNAKYSKAGIIATNEVIIIFNACDILPGKNINSKLTN